MTAMATGELVVDRRNDRGEVLSSIVLDPWWFGVEPNLAVLHQVVTAQLAARRRGTHSTKTRAEVRGGSSKPWRQKGTGRARQGSTSAPHWTGGGVAHGPKPRSYRQRTPKKMISLALRSALSDRAASGRVVVVGAWSMTEPRTKAALEALRALDMTEGRVLLVLERGSDEVVARSFRNLPTVHVLDAGELNAYDVLRSDWVVFTDASLPGSGTRAGEGDGEVPPPSVSAEVLSVEQSGTDAEVAPEPAAGDEPGAAQVVEDGAPGSAPSEGGETA
jgi:large subunit ribosomal protein L4